MTEELGNKIVNQLHELKKYGVRVVPDINTPQPMLSSFNVDMEGKSFTETYDKKLPNKISIGKSWKTEFVSDMLKLKIYYWRNYNIVQEEKTDNTDLIYVLHKFNFAKFKKKEEEVAKELE